MKERLVRKDGQQLKIWIPNEIHEWLKNASENEERSMTYLIVKALKAAKEKSEKTGGLNEQRL